MTDRILDALRELWVWLTASDTESTPEAEREPELRAHLAHAFVSEADALTARIDSDLMRGLYGLNTSKLRAILAQMKGNE